MSERTPMVAVIGDSVVSPGSPKDLLAAELGTLLVDAGFRILTGGLGGVMESVCRGAHASTVYKPGDTVGLLPGFDPDEANAYVDVIIPTGMDQLRCGIVGAADAVIAIGGGAGTLSELAHSWMLRRLIIGFRIEGWSGRVADTRLDHRIRHPELPDDRVYGADTPAEAVALLKELLPSYGARHGGVRRRR